jgi:Fe2+ transport system protein FeoA
MAIENYSQLGILDKPASRSARATRRPKDDEMTNLVQSPRGATLRIVDIAGGEGVRRRLFALGFNVGDDIELQALGILRGPVLIRNLRTGVTAAVGRGIAQKIVVEAADERP